MLNLSAIAMLFSAIALLLRSKVVVSGAYGGSVLRVTLLSV